MNRLLCSLLILALWSSGWAQEASSESRPAHIQVDRPSFANSSAVVGDGVTSLEAGVLVTTARGTDEALVQTPLLLRIGLDSDLEFRLASNLLNYQDPNFGVGESRI